jgi:hypothetical protein
MEHTLVLISLEETIDEGFQYLRSWGCKKLEIDDLTDFFAKKYRR